MPSNRAKGNHIARLIKKHGGWMEGEFIRFPSPHAMSQFFKALWAEKDSDT